MRARIALTALVAAFAAGSAVAQDNQTDEPRRIKPLFGDSEKQTTAEPKRDQTDDEFDGDKRWKPATGLVGILTFLTPEETNLSIGVGPEYAPDYFGSDDYEFTADPAAYVRFKNFVFLDDDGADFALFGFSNFRFGPTLRVVGKRDEDDNPALNGLGDVGHTFELGGFAGATFVDRYSVKFKVRHAIATGHRGLIVDGNATALLFRVGPVSTSVSAQAAWIGNDYADAYFSITPDQSLRSGLPQYEANSGFRDIGGSFNAYVNIAKRWSVNPYVSYKYIFDEYADTPIISDFGQRTQFSFGFHVMREFSFGRGVRRPLKD
ncbi:MAG: MipA/OmpV family protein [Parvularculaceae bacterium]|nr:MipA/OmpV family protein [Parvularculaceae bacterium]